jgi:hypothetical protein
MLLVCEMADTIRFTGREATFTLKCRLDQGCLFSALEKVAHSAPVRICLQVSTIAAHA